MLDGPLQNYHISQQGRKPAGGACNERRAERMLAFHGKMTYVLPRNCASRRFRIVRVANDTSTCLRVALRDFLPLSAWTLSGSSTQTSGEILHDGAGRCSYQTCWHDTGYKANLRCRRRPQNQRDHRGRHNMSTVMFCSQHLSERNTNTGAGRVLLRTAIFPFTSVE